MEVPDGWERKKINGIARVETGGTPSTKNSSFWGGNILWMSSGEVNNKKIYDTEKKITEEGVQNSNAKILPTNTILMALNGQGKTRGMVAINKVPLTCNQSLAGIICNENQLYYLFLFYTLERRYKEIRSITGNSGREGLNLGIIKEIKIALPSILEQQKIADILSKVDELIELTEKIIDETGELKKGLMQKLLTKGIGHTKFKKTEFGEIPVGWEIKKIGDFIINLDAGVSVNSKNRVANDGEFGILKTSAAFNGIFSPRKHKTINTNEISKACINPKADNIIISRMNTSELVGESAYIAKDYPNLFLPDRLWQTNFKNKKEICVKWLSFLLTSNKIKKIISNAATGTSGSMKNISKKFIFNLKISTPSLSEQKQIASILSKVDEQIQDNKKELKHLRELKKGLMQDLLTGKVRVSV